jgi:hypothetical protein
LKNMNRIITVLVLLVTVSLAAGSLDGSTALAGGFQDPGDPHQDRGDQIVDQQGSPDDDSEGDPGDAGDGYGATGDGPKFGLGDDGDQGSDSSTLEEWLLFLITMIQQLAP